MSTLRTIVVLTLAIPLLAGCAPSPEALCDHVIGLMKKELGDATPDLTEMQKECIEDTERMKKNKGRKGPFEYRKAASCIMDATTLAAVGECDNKSEK